MRYFTPKVVDTVMGGDDIVIECECETKVGDKNSDKVPVVDEPPNHEKGVDIDKDDKDDDDD